MKKIISMILAVAVISASGTSALAAETKNRIDLKNDYKAASKIFVEETDFPDIKQSPSGFYAMELDTVDGKVLQPVGRLDIIMDDTSSLAALITNEDVPDDIKISVQKEYERAQAIGNEDLKISVFSTTLLDSGVSPQGGATGFDETITKLYNGYNMRSDRVYYYGLSTGWEYVDSGSSTYTTISTITGIILVGAGLVPITAVAFSAAGISLFQIFLNQCSNAVIGGHTDDYTQVRVIYDKVIQWTRRQIGEAWYLGLLSDCATVKKIGAEIYLYDSKTKTGKTATCDRDVNIYAPTEHYDDPWAIAYQYSYATYVEEVSWKVGSKNLTF